MPKLNANERQEKILELLKQNGAMRTAELANYFRVSRETMRRDLLTLTEEGKIGKWFGGVICAENLAKHPTVYDDVRNLVVSKKPEPEVKKPSSISVPKKPDTETIKQQICLSALSLLPQNATLFLDCGELTLRLANLLAELAGYTIITTSIDVVNACLKSFNKVIVCGGLVSPSNSASNGATAIDFLNHLKTDIAIFESAGFQNCSGPTGNDLDYIQVQKAALSNSSTHIVLADSSKDSFSSLRPFADWKDIDFFITDSALDPVFRNRYASDMEIILADTCQKSNI